MPKGYWIPHLDVSNPEGFQAYRDMADAGHKRFGSKLLARGGRREVVEGKMRARNVLREFNSYDEALAYYHGPDYSRAHPLREPHSVCDFLIVEGYDGPQPPPIGTPPAAGRLKGYWIAHIDVSDPEGYKAYQADVATPFGKFGGRYLMRGGRCEVTEGRCPPAPWWWNFRATRRRSRVTVRPNTSDRSRCVRARLRSTSSSSRPSTRAVNWEDVRWPRPTGSDAST